MVGGTAFPAGLWQEVMPEVRSASNGKLEPQQVFPVRVRSEGGRHGKDMLC